MKKIILFSLISVILVSCGTSNSVVNNGLFQKRKYTSGWFIKKNKQHKKTEAEKENLAFSNDERAIKKEEVSVLPVASINQNSQLDNTAKKETKKIVSAPLNKVSSSAPKRTEKQSQLNTENGNNTITVSTIQDHETSTEKPLLKNTKEEDKSNNLDDTMLILLVILAFLIPPLAVWLASKDTTQLIISIILTLLFWLPGIIHALLVVFGVI